MLSLRSNCKESGIRHVVEMVCCNHSEVSAFFFAFAVSPWFSRSTCLLNHMSTRDQAAPATCECLGDTATMWKSVVSTGFCIIVVLLVVGFTEKSFTVSAATTTGNRVRVVFVRIVFLCSAQWC